MELAERKCSDRVDELKINPNSYMGLLTALLEKEDEKVSQGRRGTEHVLMTMQ